MVIQLELNNGVTLPAVGLGVFQTPPTETAEAVATALRTGYRHIDTAASYLNERSVGDGLRASGVDRDEVFVESKIWVSDFGFEETLHAYDKAAAKLGVDVIDLLILHQPLASQFDKTIAAYKALEVLLADGRVRAIGVSNFQPQHIDELLGATDVVPAVNQIELHPYSQERELQELHAKLGILTQAWSPIGGITFYPGFGENRKSTLENPDLREIGEAYGKTAAQVMLRWHVQEGRSAIPKSVRAERIAENFEIFDFELTADDLARIDSLDTGAGTYRPSAEMDERYLSFEIPEA